MSEKIRQVKINDNYALVVNLGNKVTKVLYIPTTFISTLGFLMTSSVVHICFAAERPSPNGLVNGVYNTLVTLLPYLAQQQTGVEIIEA